MMQRDLSRVCSQSMVVGPRRIALLAITDRSTAPRRPIRQASHRIAPRLPPSHLAPARARPVLARLTIRPLGAPPLSRLGRNNDPTVPESHRGLGVLVQGMMFLGMDLFMFLQILWPFERFLADRASMRFERGMYCEARRSEARRDDQLCYSEHLPLLYSSISSTHLVDD